MESLDKNLVIKKVGDGIIIVCFCRKCRGNPIVITHEHWMKEKKRMCEKTIKALTKI